MNREIKDLLVHDYGWVYSKDGKIEVFKENGEMAKVKWYRQGNLEINGRYVIMVRY